MSYMAAYGLGLYFSELTITDSVQGQSFFTLHFDQTATAQVKKQVNLLVHYWSETHHEGKVKYQTSVMFGHSKAEDVVKEMLVLLDKLAIPIKFMVSLGMDGPNINKSIMKKWNKVKRKKGFQPFVKCPPSFPIHVWLNSFQKGLAKYGYNAEELCLSLYYFFKRISCRKKNLFEIEECTGFDESVILCHVQNHWLSLLPALQH